ncbi:hypothetical protein [Xanthomonas graminis]|uniref:hypothetical protein n=1 Tax=Xanthomonas graminis TaxID=3390026 RepID=UPI0011875D4E|nr:hypothetical protein [Xanthomonas translucens]
MRKPVHAWARQIVRQLERAASYGKGIEDVIAGSSNNYALIVYLLGFHDQAQRACQRQIEFADRYLPGAGLQPRINLIRLHRGIGNHALAAQLIERLIERKTVGSDWGTSAGAEETAFLENIYLHEKFLLALKIGGSSVLPALLGEVAERFPALKETVSYAERVVMAGMLNKNDTLVYEGLKNPGWKASSHAGLVRTLYVSYWLAHLGDGRQAVQLVRRMSALGRASYQWKDHAILRILERLIGLAMMVGEDEAGEQLHLIRVQVATDLGDISALVSTLYRLSTLRDRYRHHWLRLAERSGYFSLPGIPQFSARKKTIADGRVLLQVVDRKIAESYRAHAASSVFEMPCHEAALA